jgi:L-ascorbate metabolism protein UlaG (beta-lactamase superfamily)
MKITKIGHCCLLIEEARKRIMTDPGMFTVGEHELENIDIIVYTHEHGDHFHLESLKELVAKNPEVTIIANSAVGKLLEEAEITYETLEGTDVLLTLSMRRFLKSLGRSKILATLLPSGSFTPVTPLLIQVNQSRSLRFQWLDRGVRWGM